MAWPCSTSRPIRQFLPREDDKYFSKKKIKVWWDTESAPLPTSADPRDLISNIVKALRYAGYEGNKIIFWGRATEDGLSDEALDKINIGIMEGYPLVNRPSKIAFAYSVKEDDKDAIFRFILLDMFKCARCVKYPVNHFIISGNKLFLRPLSVLKQLGHNILLARPSTASNIFDGCKIATAIWDWNDVAEGKSLSCQIVNTLNISQEAVSTENGANEANDPSPKDTHFRLI